jgi:hypothetical protein
VLLVLGVEIIGLLVEVQVKILDLEKIPVEVLVDHMRVEETVLHPPIHLLQLDILDQPILAVVEEEVMLLTQLCAVVLVVPVLSSSLILHKYTQGTQIRLDNQ